MSADAQQILPDKKTDRSLKELINAICPNKTSFYENLKTDSCPVARVCNLLCDAGRLPTTKEKYQSMILWSFRNLAKVESNLESIDLSGACEVICIMLKRSPKSVMIQTNGILAILSLACFEDFRDSLVKCGACKLVCDALRGFKDMVVIQKAGVCAIRNLACSKTSLASLGRACEVLCEVSRSHPEDQELQVITMKAMVKLLYSDITRKLLVDAGACEIVCNLGKRFRNNQGLQTNIVWALAKLSYLQQTQKVLASNGACKIVCEAARNFPGETRIQRDGVLTLFNLACFRSNRADLARAGALKMVCEASETSPSDLQVQVWVVAVVKNLAASGHGCKEACKVMCRSSQRFPEDEKLHSEILKGMGHLARGESLRHVLGGNEDGGVLKVINDAMKRFPDNKEIVSEGKEIMALMYSIARV